MEVIVSLATTGEQVYSTDFLDVQDRHVWELRLQICRELENAPYFSLVLFREQDLLDDTAALGVYAESDLVRESCICNLLYGSYVPLQMRKGAL